MRSLLMGQPPTTTAEATPSAAEMPAVSVETTGSFWMQSLRSKIASHFLHLGDFLKWWYLKMDGL